LHVQANKILYRAPAFEWIDCLCHRIPMICPQEHGCPLKMLERTLAISSLNRHFLRKHRSFDVKSLQLMWSSSPLSLTQLHISSDWFKSSNEPEITKRINSKHEDTNVHEMFLRESDNGDYRGFLSLFI